jgi:hypothetical protein
MQVFMNTEAEREVRDEFDSSFDVPLTPTQAWQILSDIRRVAPSIPGVKLTDVLDGTPPGTGVSGFHLNLDLLLGFRQSRGHRVAVQNDEVC